LYKSSFPFFISQSSAVEGGALSNYETAEPGFHYASHYNSDNEGSDDDRDDLKHGSGMPLSSREKATAINTAPSHDRMEKLALYSVLQPRVPVMDTDDSSPTLSQARSCILSGILRALLQC
jgi:hypothetical protein